MLEWTPQYSGCYSAWEMVMNAFVLESINPILWGWQDKTAQPEVGGLSGNSRNYQRVWILSPVKPPSALNRARDHLIAKANMDLLRHSTGHCLSARTMSTLVKQE